MQSIDTIGICGVGQMGAAAAVSFKRAGYQVLAWDNDPAQLEALPTTADQLEVWLDQHVGPTQNMDGNIEIVASPIPIDEQADVILDCISEDMDQKVALFRGFPASVERGALFITTTSGLSITEMGRRSGCGHLLAGTHFWNPPHLMPLVEVIRGEDTPDPVIDRVCQLIESIGKTPIRVHRDVPGFIGNRLLHALWREAISLVEKGIAEPEDVDLVSRLTFGLRLPVVGPLENMDLVGLDLIERIHQYLLDDLADNHGPSEYLSTSVQEGRLGVKSGQGFYDWDARNADELISRRDEQIIQQLNYLRNLQAGRLENNTHPGEHQDP
jgi:3-hydroxybutyryl-CoA dehydrogenase